MHALTITTSRAVRAIRIAAPVLPVFVGLVLALALASAIVFVFAGSAGAALTMARTRRVRSRLAALEARRRRRLRHRRRDARLKAADVSRVELTELACLVDCTIESDGAQRDVHDAEALLDHYVDLALERDRIQMALGRARPHMLEARLEALPPTCPRTQATMRRRLEHSRELTRHAAALDETAAALVDLLHYYCARAIEPAPALDHDWLTPRLDTYDAAQAADLLIEETSQGA